MTVRILVGDCTVRLAELPDNSVDSVVCDPPYHLVSIVKRFGSPDAAPAKEGKTGAFARASKGFMGQTWDGGDVAFDPATWAEVLRVLKPGGHLVAFSGTRTYHRMAVAIEDAGFEVRDMLSWLYGSGFPKSLDVSKAIDKAAGEKGEFGDPKSAAHAGWIERGRMRGDEGHEGYQRPWMQDPAAVSNAARQYLPATEAAREWQGWGTALKPACEPICLARKPLSEKSVAANVLKWGTGAINVDACRIEAQGRPARELDAKPTNNNTYAGRMGDQSLAGGSKAVGTTDQGRWPANVCHDGSDEVVAGFPAEAGAAAPVHKRGSDEFRNTYGAFTGNVDEAGSTFQGDSGSAARFFYEAKATRDERAVICRQCGEIGLGDRDPVCRHLDDKGKLDAHGHPTVKPIDLMRWLCRLVTPKGGMVLDPFAGSGSTLIAADAEQFNAIGCELSPEYVAIAEARLKFASGIFAQVTVE